MDRETLLKTVLQLEPKLTERQKSDRVAIKVSSDQLCSLLQKLRESPLLAFDCLQTHTAVDWVEQGSPGYFELLYFLTSTEHRHDLLVSVTLPRQYPVAPSVSSIYQIAEWQEREVYDLFGVLYEGHPDLRRLFLEDDWKGFPLRKDYQDPFVLERPE